jgi:hypothetical protein
MSKAYLADSLRSYYNRPFTTAEIASSSYRASAKKLTTKTRLVHPLVVGYVGVTLALWGLLHILLPLRLDGLIDTSYKYEARLLHDNVFFFLEFRLTLLLAFCCLLLFLFSHGTI